MGEKKRKLSLDVETFSSVDLAKAGVHAYTESEDFEILLIGYAFDDEPVQVWDCTGPGCWPREVLDALTDETVTKYAWNAAFERACFEAELEEEMPADQWVDTMVMALELGLPGSLAAAGAALNLAEEEQKDAKGKILINYFSKPCKPTKTNGGRTRNLPAHDKDKWKLYIEYNRQDVVTERTIRQRLEEIAPLNKSEQALWWLDQKINDTGIRVDVPMVEKIVEFDALYREELQNEAKELTGLENPNSLAQLKDWMATQGLPVATLRKDDVDELLKADIPESVRRVLEIRQALGKTSVKKYNTMLEAVCRDGRVRGMLQFYGANRSGRWSGRIVQVHNLARNSLPDLDLARQITADGDFEALETLFGEPAFIFSELVRTAFIPSEGHRFVVSDFSAIEARVISWLAGEEWRLKAFREGKDIYCETASQMYHVPVEKHGQNAELRGRGKVAELACIAEGQLVLTDKGLWDGVEWVRHDGVVYRGKKEVISYGGLEATADHIVWAEIAGEHRTLQFGDAARGGSRLLQSGAGREAIRVAENPLSGETLHQRVERMLCADRVHGMREEIVDGSREPYAGQDEGMPELQSAAGGSAMAGQTVHGGKAAVREPEGSRLQKLRSTGHPVRLPERDRRVPVHDRKLRSAGQIHGDRQDRRQRKLRSGEPALGHASAKLPEPKAVYDIMNAGPRHRFTVSGVLVHNCGFQGGVGAMKQMDRSGTIPEDELQAVVDQWRAANPRIVKLWRDYETAAKTAIKERRTVRRGVREQISYAELEARRAAAGGPVRPYSVREVAVEFSYEKGNLFVKLPSGRRLCYWGAKIREKDGREQIVYMGVNQTTKQWGTIETYGGKLVENIVQATARDCLAVVLGRIAFMRYSIVMHVHDEVICDVPEMKTDAAERITAAMSEPIDWAPGLPLKGETYEAAYYMKD